MSYIGNAPASFFTAVTSDVFSANGTANTFTLSKSISNLADIEVVVDNIQQNPFSGSYSVSGSSLTFSSTPSAGSNNIIVTYRQATIGSSIPTPNTVSNSSLQSNLSLTGNTTTQHLVPAANITYDIGTSTMRYRDIYLSGNTIYLGSAVLNANGTSFSVANATGGVFASALGNTIITGTANVSGQATVNTLVVSTNTATIGTGAYFVANGNIGVGTSNPSVRLHVNDTMASSTTYHTDMILQAQPASGTTGTSTAGGVQLVFRGTTDGSIANSTLAAVAGFINTNAVNNAGGLLIRTQESAGTGLVDAARITSSGLISLRGAAISGGSGIAFPATQSASTDANTLDDYEEGNWTPAWSVSGGTITANSNTSGKYVKIGRVVYIWGYISYQSHTGSPTGALSVTGLPFPADQLYGQQNYGGFFVHWATLWTANPPRTGNIVLGALSTINLATLGTNGFVNVNFADMNTSSANYSQTGFFGQYQV